MRDIQRIRRRWKASVRGSRAFTDFATADERWYTYNAGGRNEAQFNVGLSPRRLRIGLGFEFSKKMHGDPEAVQAMYGHFTDVFERYRPGFDRFVERNSLQVEWRAKGKRDPEYVSAEAVAEWLLHPPEPFPEWIFVGRLLYRGSDTAILEDPVRLRSVMEAVFNGFIHPWEEAQVKAC